MAGTLIVSIVQVLPSAEFFSPVYVVPCEVLNVLPNEVSELASVMTVFLYVCFAIVPLQPLLHSVPVPHLFDVSTLPKIVAYRGSYPVIGPEAWLNVDRNAPVTAFVTFL